MEISQLLPHHETRPTGRHCRAVTPMYERRRERLGNARNVTRPKKFSVRIQECRNPDLSLLSRRVTSRHVRSLYDTSAVSVPQPMPVKVPMTGLNRSALIGARRSRVITPLYIRGWLPNTFQCTSAMYRCVVLSTRNSHMTPNLSKRHSPLCPSLVCSEPSRRKLIRISDLRRNRPLLTLSFHSSIRSGCGLSSASVCFRKRCGSEKAPPRPLTLGGLIIA
mmetsp:Transcript_41375/g.103265  ORF Transcript_41375/g.103265 Transcript_41375/m.103265 type:complete len:221 (-) Transcript_41375:160-822(-)